MESLIKRFEGVFHRKGVLRSHLITLKFCNIITTLALRCQNVAKILSDIVATFWQRSANVVMLQNFKENTNEIATCICNESSDVLSII